MDRQETTDHLAAAERYLRFADDRVRDRGNATVWDREWADTYANLALAHLTAAATRVALTPVMHLGVPDAGS